MVAAAAITTAPLSQVELDWAQDVVKKLRDIGRVKVDLLFDPRWDFSRMSDEAKTRLKGI